MHGLVLFKKQPGVYLPCYLARGLKKPTQISFEERGLTFFITSFTTSFKDRNVKTLGMYF